MSTRASNLALRLADGPARYFGEPLPKLPAECRITSRSRVILGRKENPGRQEDVLFRLLATMPRYVASLEIERWHKDGDITLEQRHTMWLTCFGAEPPQLGEVA